MANRTNTLINIHGVDSQWHICMWMKILRRITDCHQIDATYEGFFARNGTRYEGITDIPRRFE